MAKKQDKKYQGPTGKPMPLGKDNYMWMAIGFGLIILGFILMAGGGSDDPDVYNYEMFNFRRITLAPILVLAGFGVEIYAIMKKSKNEKKEETK